MLNLRMTKGRKVFAVLFILLVALSTLFASLAFFTDRANKTTTIKVSTFNDDGYSIEQQAPEGWFVAGETLEVQIKESNEKEETITSHITMHVVWNSPVDGVYPWGNDNSAANAVITLGGETIPYTSNGDTITFTLPQTLLNANKSVESLLNFQIPSDLVSTGRLYFSYDQILLSQYPSGWSVAYDGMDLSELSFDVGVIWNISNNQNTKDVVAYLTDGSTADDTNYGLCIVKAGADANTNKGVMQNWTAAGETPWADYTITELSIGENVTTIGDYAFAGETGITSLAIPSTVTDIGISAFDGSGLTGTLIIPATVESIDSLAFANLPSVNTISFAHSSTDSLEMPDNTSSGKTSSGAFYAGLPYTPTSPLGTTILSDNDDILNYAWNLDARGYVVTVQPVTGVTVVASPTTAIPGKSIVLAPTASAGYEYTGCVIAWGNESTTLAADKLDFTMPAANVTVTPNVALITYAIHYETNGGTLSDDAPDSYNVTTDTFVLPEPARDGYTFDGWYEDSACSGAEVTQISQGTTGDKTFYAKWTANTDTPYIVKHWKQKLNGGDEENSTNFALAETEHLTGTTDTKVIPDRKSYTGFTAPDGVEITIGGDGKTELNYYYTRNSYTFTLGSCNGVSTSGSSPTGSYKYEATITLSAATSVGYTWDQWISSATSLVGNKTSANTTFTMPAGNLSMTPNATLDSYSITYFPDGGTLPTGAPTSYTIESSTFALPTPTKTGYTFVGWYTSSDLSGNKVTQIYTGSTGDKTFYAKWTANRDTAYIVYHWKQQLDGSSEQNSVNFALAETENKTGTTGSSVTPDVMDYEGFTAPTPQTVTIAADGSTVVNYYYTRNSYTFTLGSCDGVSTTGSTVSGTYRYEYPIGLVATTSTGYTWVQWISDDPSLVESLGTASTGFFMPAGDIQMTPNATLNTYTIEYELNGGTQGSGAATSYTVESTVTLPTPTKTGYTFAGWYEDSNCSGSKVTQIVKGTTGNKMFYAKWTPNSGTAYTVNHYQQNIPDDGYTLKETENKTGTTGNSVTPAVKTYTGFTSPSTQTVTIEADGSTVVNYYYTRNRYTFTLGSCDGVSTTGSTASGTYKYGATITLCAAVSDGYTWNTWTSSNTSLVANKTAQNTTFTMPDGAITVTPNASLDTYTIEYELNGGTQGSGAVTSYTVESTVTLPTPTKTGYTFAGWYEDSNCSGSKVTQIVKGTTGNKMFYAKWTPSSGTAYTVNHYQQNIPDDGYTLKETENKTGTTGNSVIPAVKTYTGFTSPSTQTVTIAADGSTVVNYYYTRNRYTFTLGSCDGVSTTGSTASGTYKYGATITLKATASVGYTWNTWTSSNTSLVANKTAQNTTFTMPDGAITMTPNASLDTYTIKYELNGGTQGSGAVASYTVETSTFSLPIPTKTGYAFAGWYENSTFSGTAVTQITKGTTGDKTFYANWTANTNTAYTVKHWQQTLTGGSAQNSSNFSLAETEKFTGTTGTSVTPAVKTYTGFTSPSTQTVTIAADGSTVVNYYYTRNSYEFTLGSCNGVSTTGSTASGSYRYGYSIALSATTSEGYTWNSWKSSNTSLVSNVTATSGSFTMPADNITMTPVASLITYSIGYELNGGIQGRGAVSSYTVESSTIALPTPTKTGYDFAGWYEDSSFSGDAVSQIDAGSTGDKVYYAKWTAKMPILAYSDTWYSQGGTEISRSSIATITFVDKIDEATVSAAGANVWDASAGEVGTVYAYLVETGTDTGLYNLTIAGNGYGRIFANANSGMAFSEFSNATAIYSANLLDTCNTTTMVSMFSGCYDLITPPDTSNWVTSMVTSMNGMFSSCSSMTTAPDTSGWDTSSLTNIVNMFNACSDMTTPPDTSNWDTSKVTSLGAVFCNCSSLLTPPDTSGWNTSLVTTLYNMFYGCNALTAPPDTSNWDVRAVKSTFSMFQSCFAMAAPPDTSNWVTSSLTDVTDMFASCKSMTTPPITTNWDTDLITTMERMFIGCAAMEAPPDTSKWITTSLTNLSNMFNGCTTMASAPVLTSWDTSKVTAMDQMFYSCKSFPTLDLSSFDTRSITSADGLSSFAARCYNLTDITLGTYFVQSSNAPDAGETDSSDDCGGLFYVDCYIKAEPLRTTVTGANAVMLAYDWGEDHRGFLVLEESVTGGTITANKSPAINGATITLSTTADDGYTYGGSTVSYTLNGDAKTITLDADTTTFTMPAADVTITPVWNIDGEAFAVFSAGDGSLTFYYDVMPAVGDTFNGKIVTEVYTGYETALYNSDTEVPWYANMANIKSVSFTTTVAPKYTCYWFYNATNMTSFDQTNLDTSNTKSMTYMFRNCSSLENLDVTGFVTSKSINFAYMFSGCSKLTTIDVSKFNTSSAYTIAYMFSDCTALISMDLSPWNSDSSNTSGVNNMSYLFQNCTSLQSVNLTGLDTLLGSGEISQFGSGENRQFSVK